MYSVHVREERGDRELEYKEARQMGDAYAMIKTQINFLTQSHIKITHNRYKNVIYICSN